MWEMLIVTRIYLGMLVRHIPLIPHPFRFFQLGMVANKQGQSISDHCIEALRENLMCQGDVSVFTFKKFPELEDQGIEGNWPDFSINHMCRNFEAIKKWNNDHAASWDYHA